MPSTLSVLLGAAGALGFWTLIGLSLSRRLMPRDLALPLAPALGWAMHSAVALPLFSLIGFGRATVIAVTVVAALGAVVALRRDSASDGVLRPRVPVLAYALAALLAFGVAAAVLPKVSAEGVALAVPIFDHSKAAMIDEMVRHGVPPINAFYGGPGAGEHLSYYYLWHFSAAELAVVLGLTGWAADAAMTLFSAFASLALMMGLAVRLAGRPVAATVAVVLAGTASLRPALMALFGNSSVDAVLQWPTGFGGWLLQSTWAPQHQAAAASAVLAMLMLARLAERPAGVSMILTVTGLALTTVTAFQSSAWIGGIAFPLAATLGGVSLLAHVAPQRRLPFAAAAVAAAVLALVVALPFLLDQAAATTSRGGDWPVTLRPYSVFNDAVPFFRTLDLPSFWLVTLPLEFPAFAIAGLAMLVIALRRASAVDMPRTWLLSLASLTAASLVVAWLLASTIGDNNDLGWRAVLPAVMAMIAFAAAGLVRWAAEGRRLAAVLALGGVLLGVPEGIRFLQENLIVPRSPVAQAFAQTPALWEAVRRHAGPDERIASNPMFMRAMTAWPVNISWALLGRQRSCFAGADLTLPFVPLPLDGRKALVELFERVFDGALQDGDLATLVGPLRCRVMVVTPSDGAWMRDPFAVGGLYRMVEDTPGWRILRAVSP